MADAPPASKPITVMGAGLSGLAAAIVLAKAGREVHVHDIRQDSGARFDGDFQALENWSMDEDFFDQLEGGSVGRYRGYRLPTPRVRGGPLIRCSN